MIEQLSTVSGDTDLTHEEFFHTRDEARAFIRGIEFTEDPRLRVKSCEKQSGFEEGEEDAWKVVFCYLEQ